MDGTTLSQLILGDRVGVTRVAPYGLKRLDSDYFIEASAKVFHTPAITRRLRM